MKREIVTTVNANVLRISPSTKFASEFNVIVEGDAHNLHKNLAPQRGNGQFSLSAGGNYIESIAKASGLVTPKSNKALTDLVCAYSKQVRATDLPCIATIEVERRVVGETLEDENGTPVTNSQGQPVVFAGTTAMQHEGTATLGAEYYIATISEITLSGSFNAKAVDFVEKQAIRMAEEDEGVSLLPARPSRNSAEYLAKLQDESEDKSSTKKKAENTKV